MQFRWGTVKYETFGDNKFSIGLQAKTEGPCLAAERLFRRRKQQVRAPAILVA